jgi:hypothetical protein
MDPFDLLFDDAEGAIWENIALESTYKCSKYILVCELDEKITKTLVFLE